MKNMSHQIIELKRLKEDVSAMWNLVINQMEKTKVAIETFDENIVNEIAANEKRVDAFELKLDMDCENILALFNPLANDLRFVLSVIKINYNLERIGDYAKDISGYVKVAKKPYSKELLQETHVIAMFEIAIDMLKCTLAAFESETNQQAISVFAKDEYLDQVNRNANKTVAEILKRNSDDMEDTLQILSFIRKLERVGDQTQNIAEEIIFYLEAKVLKHKKNKTIE
jgi:phosphate transport system protein